MRPIAIGVIRRGDALLVVGVADDTGAIRGWRPLGGCIEFGERAVEALRREFMEELSEPITEPKLIKVVENLYEHHGARGHEIVFVYETGFANRDVYRRDGFRFRDGSADNTALWVDVARFRAGDEQLFPVGLRDLI